MTGTLIAIWIYWERHFVLLHQKESYTGPILSILVLWKPRNSQSFVVEKNENRNQQHKLQLHRLLTPRSTLALPQNTFQRTKSEIKQGR